MYTCHKVYIPLVDKVMSDVLKRCAKNEGMWLKKNEIGELHDLKWRKLKHTSKTPADFSAKLLNITKVATNKQLVASPPSTNLEQQNNNLPSSLASVIASYSG